MASRIVKQPNGRFARWSDQLHQFTHINLLETEILNVCLDDGFDAQDALNLIGMAKADAVDPMLFPPQITPAHDGLDRWREALFTLEVAHGAEARRAAETYNATQLPATIDGDDDSDLESDL